MDKNLAETLIFKYDFQHDIMEKVFERVVFFLKKHNRILVGGMAIDFALRLVGKKLYPDNQFPDYDFYSPEFHIDAYRLGSDLATMTNGVSVIGAYHISTMKVRVNFQEAADISYIPENLYSSIPTLKYRGFTIVHPHYQMIDQHRSLSTPYENPPLETILSRWRKDTKRYLLLHEVYPVKAKYTKQKLKKITIDHSMVHKNCLSGVISLIYWATFAKKHALLPGNPPTWLTSMKISPEDDIECELPTSLNVTLLSDFPSDVIGKSAVKYNPILDKVAERYIFNGYEIINNHGQMRSAQRYNRYEVSFHISNLQEVMCYTLTMGILYNNSLMLYCYTIARNIYLNAVKAYNTARESKRKNLLYQLLPTQKIYGRYNYYDAVKVAKNKTDVKLRRGHEKYPTPKNAYPTQEAPDILAEYYEFDIKSNPLYNIDGEQSK